MNVDDIMETANHFRCVDMIIDHAKSQLTEKFIKDLHLALKSGTSDSRLSWFAVGNYKKRPNEVGGLPTARPSDVPAKIKKLLAEYNAKDEKTLEDILEFHVQFERIHPFQDGNGRVGRLIMFKECLRHGIMPFIIDDKRRSRYLRGIKEWHDDRFEMIDVVMEAQDRFEAQIELQRLHAAGQFFAPVSYQEGFDDEDE